MKKLVFGVLAVVLVSIILISSIAFAADDDANSSGRPGGRSDRFGGDRGDRMAQMMKQQLNVTDEEWTVIGPRLTEVMTLSRQSNVRMGRSMRRPGGPDRGDRGDRGGRGDRPERRQRPDMEQSQVQKAAEDLSTTLENSESTTEQITAKLTALRKAKEQAKQQLSQAQQELKKVLTLRQEAKLVAMGLLN